MDKLIFLNNELMNPHLQKEMHLPLEFISFGIIDGKMYRHFRNNSVFVLPHQGKDWGNTVIYGAIFLCRDFDFYARIFDAYHICSLSTMMRNHVQDIHHRSKVDVTPIYFDSLEELSRLKYREGTPIETITYFGNPTHPKIKQRLIHSALYRIVYGVDKQNFKELWRVVNEQQ